MKNFCNVLNTSSTNNIYSCYYIFRIEKTKVISRPQGSSAKFNKKNSCVL